MDIFITEINNEMVNTSDFCNPTNTINASDESVAESLHYQTALVIYTTVVLPVILVIGLLANGLFITVVERIENMKNVTNAYLSSLAVADMLFLLLVIGHKLWKIIGSPEVVIDDSCLGVVGCSVMFVGSSTTYFASLCFITLVAWERRQAVRYPHLVGKNRFHNRSKAAKMITISWVLSFLLAVSFVPSFSVFHALCIIWPKGESYLRYPRKVYVCDSVSPALENYTHVTQALPFFASMSLNLFLYFDIMRALKESAERIQSFDPLAKAASRKQRDSRTINQTVRMLVINGLCFFALLAPFEVLSVCILFDGWIGNTLISTSSVGYRTFAWVARTLSYINSVINPVIYTVFSSRYRKAFRDTVFEVYICFVPSQQEARTRNRGRPVSTTPMATNDWNENTRGSIENLETQDTKL